MPARDADLVVVGLGAMGAAVAWQAAARGLDVIGIDARTPPHSEGSTHGRSRIIREAYFEHPQYVPLVRRAYQLWAGLEHAARARLFQACGGLMIGAADGPVVAGTLRAASEHGLTVQTWTAADLRARVPPLQPLDGMLGVFEPRAGVLSPEAGVRAMLAAARMAGARLHTDEPVRRWAALGHGIEVETDSRTVRASTLALAAGPWLPALLGAPALPLQVERVVQYWYTGADPRTFAPAAFPVFLIEAPDGRMLYGLPDQGEGLKLAEHHGGEATTPESVRREVADDEQTAFHAFASRWVSGLPGEPAEASVCLYTNTPDRHFVLDWHPAAAGVYVCSPCSGHGFKFAPAVGEAVAAELAGARAGVDLSPFRLTRFPRFASPL